MNSTLKTIKRNCLGIITLLVAFAVFILAEQFSGAADDLTDMEKRQRIEKMYLEYKIEFPEVADVTPREAMRLASKQKVVFIDVRESKEQKVSLIPGAITHREFLKNPEKYNDFYKIGYCTISYRSGKLAQKLKKKGILMVNLQGGILAWVHDGGTVVNENNQTHRVHVYGRKWNLVPQGYEAVW